MPKGKPSAMQITVTISDAVVREAAARGATVSDFVESLIDKGMLQAKEPPVVSSAMERIRLLRTEGVETRR
jgi:hypothetical protein